MCLGLPMQVVKTAEGYALCEVDGEIRRIDTMLIGEQQAGTWLLTFLDTAREVLSEEKAQQIREALQALELTMRGEAGVDHLFADLVEREPQLPDFLRPAANEQTPGE